MTQVKSRHKVAQMFDQIAFRYDQMNRFLSLGQDMKWRKKIQKYLPNLDNYKIVDLACGTGDQIIALKNLDAKFLGIDISKEMLKIAKKKLEDDKRVELMLGSALDIPLEDESANIVTMSFGMRNVSDPVICIQEISRILDKDGVAFILEFSKPENSLIRGVSSFYINRIVPLIGARVSKAAYQYLPDTIEEFASGREFLDIMEENGLTNCRQIPMNFGTVSLYIGEKR